MNAAVRLPDKSSEDFQGIESVLKCKGCGVIEPVPVPVNISLFNHMVNKFHKEHERCGKKE